MNFDERPSDAELVQGYLNGDEEAWDVLWARYRDKLIGYFINKGVNPNDSEDLAQDTLIEAMVKLSDLRNPAAFGGWLFAIAHGIMAKWFTEESKRAPHVSLESGMFNDGLAETGAAYFLAAPAHLQPEERAIAKEEESIILDLIQRLPQSQKEVLQLKISDPDMKLEEIADALGIQLNTVKQRLHRARKALAARLEAEYPGEFTLLLRKWVDE